MAATVFVHVGLPKTATTYLQTILWQSRGQARADGLLLPGDTRRDHLWSSRLVRGLPARGFEDAHAEAAWDRVRDRVADWPDRALISHEFFAAASREQAEAVVRDLAPARVELIVTARDPLGLFAAGWQESLKNRETVTMADFAPEESDSPAAVWNWRTLDLHSVLQRWGGVVTPERVHVLPLPGRDLPRDTIWQRFAGILGLDPAAYDADAGFANSSLGVVEAETLRRINEHLVRRDELGSALERGNYIRTYLADERLVPRGGERYWPTAEQVEECRRRGERAADFVREQGYDVVGDLDDLRVPAALPERRQVTSVTDGEVADVATDLVALLTTEVRDLRREVHRGRRELRQREAPTGPAPRLLERAWARLRRR